jgi:hypothetical protein
MKIISIIFTAAILISSSYVYAGPIEESHGLGPGHGQPDYGNPVQQLPASPPVVYVVPCNNGQVSYCSCNFGHVAIGGGGKCDSSPGHPLTLSLSTPLNLGGGGNPTAWSSECSDSKGNLQNSGTTYVICTAPGN